MWLMDLFKKVKGGNQAPLYFYNTLTKQKERFGLPPVARTVRMYNCGPTVYDTSHIGNLRSYVFADLIYRVLTWNRFEVKQVINITDFGHLSSDADAGPDKMTKALKREKMTLTMENMRTLAEKYAKEFIEDLEQLNIDTSHINFPRASDHIVGEIALIRTLEEKGYTYKGADGVYYNTALFKDYGKLGTIDLEGLRSGARVATSDDKRNPTDFLLWKSDKKLGWDSPWGKGFPGWHIECSAMINSTLGKQIDIHTGGIDLLPTHHNNEIAQSEIATGKKPFSRFWMHHEFLNLSNVKISKSLGNVINLPSLIQKGYHPLSYRYFLLGAHYKTPLSFTWEALQGAQNAYANLLSIADRASQAGVGTPSFQWLSAFRKHINDDLDTPGALATLWEMTKDTALSPANLYATLIEMDKVLGLSLCEPDELAQRLMGKELDIAALPQEVKGLVDEREAARENKDWAKADALRAAIEEKGFVIQDTAEGVRMTQG